MRSILSILALFSLTAPAAQPVEPSFGRELPRSEMICYPTAAEAAEGNRTDSRYLKPLTEWVRRENTFSTAFNVPFNWVNRSILLGIASASSDYEVHLNGKPVAYNADANLPAEFDLTRLVREGLNSLEIVLSDPPVAARMESWKNNPDPALGRVQVMSQPVMRIRDVFTRTWEIEEGAKAEIGIVIKSGALNPKTSRIHYELLTPANETAAIGFQDMTLDMRREDTMRFIVSVPRDLLWRPEMPLRYTLRLKTQYEGRFAEFFDLELGLRTLEVKDGNLRVNRVPATLRIQEVSPQIAADELAGLKESGYNTLRLRAGAVPASLYDMCDTMGLYVIVQAPIDTRNSGDSRKKGGNPTNDPSWLPAYLERVQDSYHTAKRHPSVIAFSLAEQSSNGINLYESYLLMKRLERERPVLYPDAEGEWNNDPLDSGTFDAAGR